MAQEEARGPSEAGVTPGRGARDDPAAVRAVLERLRDCVGADGGTAASEVRLVVEAVLADQAGAGPEGLEVAGRNLGRTHLSVVEMVERVSQLRAVLGTASLAEPTKMHRALDRITAAATDEVLSRVERLTRTDALTGVGNRRAFDETIQWALSASARQGHDVTVVAVDVDGLKQINDSKGHAAGDAVLISLVKAFYDTLRDEDMMFRVGGDEFIVVLPFTSVDDAEALMRRVAAEAPAFTWGAAGHKRDGSGASELVAAADMDMYRRRGLLRGQSASAAGASAREPSHSLRGTGTRLLRWSWVVPAAVIVASLIVTLASGGAPAQRIAARAASSRSAHASRPSGSTRSAAPARPAAGPGQSSSVGGSGTSSGAATASSPVLSVSTSPGASAAFVPGAEGSPADGISSTESSGGTPPGSSPTPGSAPSEGGLLGTTGALLTPVPGIGGNGGLLQVVDQVLVGAPSKASTPTAGAGVGSGSGSDLLAALGGV